MKSLVVFYSRSGNTKKVAQEISKVLETDLEEIIDEKDRSGVLGYMSAGKDATFGSLGKIKKSEKNPEEYDLVIVGTPVWAFTVSTPVKTYLNDFKGKIKDVAFFATQGGSGAEKAFKEMEKLTVNPKSTLIVSEAEIKNESYTSKAREFSEKLIK